MANESSEHTTKKRRKWPWIVLLVLIGIIGLVRIALLTSPVHLWVKNIIVTTANKQLKPELSIGSLKGDLWNDITLTNIKLTEDSTLASTDTLKLRYNLLSYFSDAFQIQQIRMVKPKTTLAQQQESTWNVQHWAAGTDTSAADTSGSMFELNIANFTINKGSFNVKILGVNQDSAIVLDSLNLKSSFGLYQDHYEASFDNFDVKVRHTPLDAPLSFTLKGKGTSDAITLEKLAIATGHSMFSSSGKVSIADSTADLKAKLTPLGWKDIAALADEAPFHRNLDISVHIKGDAKNTTVSIDTEAKGIEQLHISSALSLQPNPALKSLKITSGELNLQAFLADTTMPVIKKIKLNIEGNVPFEKYEEAKLKGQFLAEGIRQNKYRLDELKSTFSLSDGNADIQLSPVQGREKIIADTRLKNIWADRPAVRILIKGSDINPAQWLLDDAYAGRISFNGNVSGAGWYPQKNFWNYALNIYNSTISSQSIDSASVKGRFNQESVINQTRVNIARNKLAVNAEVSGLQAIPRFSFEINTKRLNLADFGFKDYPGSIRSTISGSGRGNSLENLKLQAKAAIDSSVFMSERIQKLELNIKIADTTATIRQAVLKSGIADADFEGRMHLKRWYDLDNSLNFDLQVKDLSSLAKITSSKVLQAEGTVKGEIKPSKEDTLIFNGDIDLKNINYNQEYTAEELKGNLKSTLAKNPDYTLNFDIANPVASSITLQNMSFKTEGSVRDSLINGSFQIELAGAGKEQISQAGDYHLSTNSARLKLSRFDLSSSLRTLSLSNPFHVNYSNGVLKTDTLFIASKDDSSSLRLAVPYVDSLRQKAYLKGTKLNLAVIQKALFNQVFIKGILSGTVSAERSDTSLTASGDLLLNNLMYQNTKLDTLRLQTDIQRDKLKAALKLYQDSTLIADGNLNLPFRIEDPSELPDNFYEQPVKGHIKLHTFKLSRFSDLLKQAGFKNTDGIVAFDGSLDGKVGAPRMKAKLSVRQAKLSGVPVDSLIANINYQHQKSNLNVNAMLASSKSKMLNIDADVPVQIDLKNMAADFPANGDSVTVNADINNFNLKVLNDFLNPDLARNLEGRVNGKLKVEGSPDDYRASGSLKVSKAAVRIVPAGIRLDHITTDISVKPDGITVENLHIESGKGKLNGQGTVALKELVPADMDITINAKNFKVANTDKYNAVVDLDMDVNGTMTKPKISGKLNIINGFVELDNFGEKSVEDVQLDTADASEIESSTYDSLSLNMNVAFNKRFFVRNKKYLELEAELDGQVNLLKDPGKDLQIFGTLNTADGYAKPLGKRFELQEGSLAFSGPPGNPQVNIKTLYEPPNSEQKIKIYYIIKGTVEKPEFKYDSSPPMDLAGIISYTLFGRPFYKLNSSEQSVASSSSSNAASDLAMEVLLDRFESLATRKFGIDVVRIENTRSGGEQGTSVTTGWYINPKVFFAIQNVITGSTPSTGFYLEYYLKENLKLILSQGADNRQGADVEWELDY